MANLPYANVYSHGCEEMEKNEENFKNDPTIFLKVENATQQLEELLKFLREHPAKEGETVITFEDFQEKNKNTNIVLLTNSTKEIQEIIKKIYGKINFIKKEETESKIEFVESETKVISDDNSLFQREKFFLYQFKFILIPKNWEEKSYKIGRASCRERVLRLV